jgi:hypothetical protein
MPKSASLVPILALFGIVVMSIAGCRQTSEPYIAWRQTMKPPVVMGLIVTDEFGNRVAVYGKVLDPTDPTGDLVLGAPFPNPSCGGTITMKYTVMAPANIRLWIVAALAPGESDDNAMRYGDAVLFRLGGKTVRTLIDERKTAGAYSVIWDHKDDNALKIPAGFYRVYATNGNVLLWHDVFYSEDASNVPAYLRGINGLCW